MATLTEQGLVIRRYPVILEEIKNKLRADISNDLLFDDDTILGQITKIIAREHALLEEMLQLLDDSWDKDKAEGSALDRLFALVGLSRLQAEKTSGNVLFKAKENTSINVNTKVRNPTTKDVFVSTSTVRAEITNCHKVEINLDAPEQGDVYIIEVNGATLSYTAAQNDGLNDVVNYFVSTINGMGVSYEASVVSEDDDNYWLEIHTIDKDNINVALLDKATVKWVYVNVPFSSEQYGAINTPPNSVTQLLSGVGGVDRITNEEAFGLGRLLETDLQFRQRAKGSLAVRGRSTYNAMLTAIENIPFTSNVLLVENASGNPTADGVPPYSFEVILDAAETEENNQEIAKVIWENKPLGIKAFGTGSTASVITTDVAGNEREVGFTRPDSVWIGVLVEYSVYGEEPLTPNISEVIKQSVLDFTKTLTTGNDVIPRRFIGGIYNATSGIGNISVKIKEMDSEGSQLSPDDPTLLEDVIAISNRQRAAFKFNNILTKEL